MNDFCRPEDCSCIQGIKCDVKDCVYNDKCCHCTANSILVAADRAACDDAICGTFRKG